MARDRDRLRQEVLEGLGWRLYRIWGLAWYRDRAGEEQRLRVAIAAALEGPVATRMYFSDLSTTTARGDLARAIRSIVDVEGPLTEELLLARPGECWPGQKFVSSRVVTVKKVLSSLVHREELIIVEPGVFDRVGRPLVTVRRAGACRRDKIGHVPPIELALAIRNVCRDARSIDQDELTAKVASIFGWQRRGKDIAAALERAVVAMLDQGELAGGPDGRLSVLEPSALPIVI